MKTHPSNSTLIVCAGDSCLDAIFQPVETKLAPGRLSLVTRGGVQLGVAYHGDPVVWNEKRDATGDLSWLLPHADDLQPGGGGLNSALHLGQTGRTVVLLDEADSAPARVAAEALGVSYCPVVPGRPPRVSGVICAPDARRVIMRGPAVAGGGWKTASAAGVAARPGAVLINSARIGELIASLCASAEAAGVPVVSVATTALPVAARVECLVARSTVTIANLPELSELAGFAGIDCPRDEETADLRAVAAGMREVQSELPCAHLAVTLGSRGCLALDAESGGIIHAGLVPRWQREFDLRLRRRRGGVNGAGDIFAAGLAGAVAGKSAQLETGDVFRAVRQGTREVLTALCPGLRLESAAVGWSFIEPPRTRFAVAASPAATPASRRPFLAAPGPVAA